MNRNWNNIMRTVTDAIKRVSERLLYGETRKIELSRKYNQQVRRAMRRIEGGL